MRTISKTIVFFLLLAGSFSCHKKREHMDCRRHDDCPKELNCTMNLVSLNLQVQDVDGNPVVLDKIISTKVSDNTSYTSEGFPENSQSYSYWGDGLRSVTSREGETLIVKGYKNGNVVFTHSMKVSQDCCHVMWVEGERNLVVVLPQ